MLHSTNIDSPDLYGAGGLPLPNCACVDDLIPVSNQVRTKTPDHDHVCGLLHLLDLILFHPLPCEALPDHDNRVDSLPNLCFYFFVLHQQDNGYPAGYKETNDEDS